MNIPIPMNTAARAAALIAGIILWNPQLSAEEVTTVAPPVARKVEKRLTIHGDTLIDNYDWLRVRTSDDVTADEVMRDEAVISYLKAENAYVAAVMKPSEIFREALYKEMVGRIKETDEDVPYREGGYLYYSRTEEGKQYPLYARKRAKLEGREEITLDLNELAKGFKYMAIQAYDVSPDGNLLAYSTDSTGSEEWTLFLKDLRTGTSAEVASRVSSAFWANDNKTLFYVVDDPTTKRPYRLYRHILGKEKDEMLYEEEDEKFDLALRRSRSRGFLFARSLSFTTSEVRFIPADKPFELPQVVQVRQAGHEYDVEHHDDRFFIRTNDQGSTNFKLMSAPVSDPRKDNWKEVVPHRHDVMLEGIDAFADCLVLTLRQKGLPKLHITDLRGDKSHDLQFPESVYSANVEINNKEFNSHVLRLKYESFTTPPSVYDYDMLSRTRVLLKQTPVLGGYDASSYDSERIYATASDGTRIPISLVYKKPLQHDGKRPLLLEGYGAYGIPREVRFDSERLSLLDRGVIFARAHIRGGGEMGREWYYNGRMQKKMNTFTDFISCAEHLIGEKRTSKDRLIITGRSAGGLLMGAVTNMRPDLFRAVVAVYPFVDIINTMLDAKLPLTIQEYEQWGNPNKREDYLYMKSYSPYDNIAPKDYPALLVRASLNDSSVKYWEPAKYVAKLRATKTDHSPLLLKTNMDAGHSGASGRYDRYKEAAFDYTFILTQLGVTE